MPSCRCTSHFSFLRGASSCEELFAQAALLGIEALAIVDRNQLAGIVRAHEAAKATGVRLIVGCRLDLADGMSVLVYPTDRPAYARLCRLLSLGKKRGGKAKCHLDWADVVAYGEGLIAVLVPDEADDDLRAAPAPPARGLRRSRLSGADPAPAAERLSSGCTSCRTWRRGRGVPTVVTNDVLFHEPARRILQDVVTCIRHNCTIDDARLPPRAPRRPLSQAARGDGTGCSAAIPRRSARTLEIAERCRFSLDELAYQYPEERDDARH